MNSSNVEEIESFVIENEDAFTEEERRPLLNGDSNTKKTTSIREIIFGFALRFLACTIFTINGILVQYFELDSVDTVTVRSILQILFLGILIKLKGMPLLICSVDEEENIFKINGFIFLQAICSGTILLFTYIALLYMPFGDAMTIVFTSPIFAMILSKIFLNEPCSMYKTFSLISLTLGVMLVLQPPFIFGQSNRTTDIEIAKTKRGKEYYYGASLAFGSAIASALHCVSVGRLFRNSTSNSALLLAFYGGVGGLLVILPAAYVDKSQSVFSTNIVNIMPRTWGLLLSVSMLGLIGFVAVNLSLKKIKPVYASFVGVSEIALAYICQVTIFHTVPSLCGIIGSIMVVITVCTLPFEAIISERFRKLGKKI